MFIFFYLTASLLLCLPDCFLLFCLPDCFLLLCLLDCFLLFCLPDCFLLLCLLDCFLLLCLLDCFLLLCLFVCFFVRILQSIEFYHKTKKKGASNELRFFEAPKIFILFPASMFRRDPAYCPNPEHCVSPFSIFSNASAGIGFAK